jgi:hypothetical protein
MVGKLVDDIHYDEGISCHPSEPSPFYRPRRTTGITTLGRSARRFIMSMPPSIRSVASKEKDYRGLVQLFGTMSRMPVGDVYAWIIRRANFRGLPDCRAT